MDYQRRHGKPSAEFCFGRETLCKEVTQEAVRARAVLLFGGRQSGKTTTLLRIAQELSKDRGDARELNRLEVPVYVDLMQLRPGSGPELFFDLVTSLASSACARQIAGFEIELPLRLCRADDALQVFWDNIELLRTAAGEVELGLVFLLDEAARILGTRFSSGFLDNIFHILYGVAPTGRHLPSISMVFAGAQDLYEFAIDDTSPIASRASRRFVTNLSIDAVEQMFSVMPDLPHVDLTRLATLAHERTGGHAGMLAGICDQIVERSRPKVGVSEEALLEEVLVRLAPAHAALFDVWARKVSPEARCVLQELSSTSALSLRDTSAILERSGMSRFDADRSIEELRFTGVAVLRGDRIERVNPLFWSYVAERLPQRREAADHVQGSGAELEPVTPALPARVFSWIHLSDLHFGAGSEKHRFDHKGVMRAIQQDVHKHAPKGVNRIFITGDIAFSAHEEQYKEAWPWFVDIAKAARVDAETLRFVPGNHDVDRTAAKRAVARSVHFAVRERRVELDTVLAQDEGRAALLAKLARYRSFIAGVPGHPAPLSMNDLDWFEVIPASPGSHGAIRVAGLSSVWISDEDDGNKEEPFRPNMMLAQGPLDATFGEADVEEELVFALSHHPQEWFHKDALSILDRELVRLPHIQLCGHVHHATAGVSMRFGSKRKAVRHVAGAAHGDPSEASKHSYAWGAIRFDPAKGCWEAGWAPRIYVAARSEMRADATEYDLDAEGFTWKEIDCPWPHPPRTRSATA